MKLYQDVPHGTLDYPFQVHESYCEHGLSLYPHVHPEIEITVITKGKGAFYIDGKEYSVKQGDCIFVSPNKIHLSGSDNQNREASFWYQTKNTLYILNTSIQFFRKKKEYHRY